MKRPLLIGLGVVIIVVGGVWTLQGLNLLGGSAMSGDTTWAIIGPIVLIVGVVLLVLGLRTPPARGPRAS